MSTSDSHETFCFNLFLFGFFIFISSRQIVQNASKYHVTNFSPKYEISGYQIMLVRSNRVAQYRIKCMYMRFTFLENIFRVYWILLHKTYTTHDDDKNKYDTGIRKLIPIYVCLNSEKTFKRRLHVFSFYDMSWSNRVYK